MAYFFQVSNFGISSWQGLLPYSNVLPIPTHSPLGSRDSPTNLSALRLFGKLESISRKLSRIISRCGEIFVMPKLCIAQYKYFEIFEFPIQIFRNICVSPHFIPQIQIFRNILFFIIFIFRPAQIFRNIRLPAIQLVRNICIGLGIQISRIGGYNK